MNDSKFDNLLRSARVEVPLPGAFQAEVWRRIAREQDDTLKSRFAQFVRSLFEVLSNPVAATVMVLTIVLAGLWFGSMNPAAAHDAKIAYVQSVSPFAASHSGHSP